jgi:solute:Na+ symporter, SSS family
MAFSIVLLCIFLLGMVIIGVWGMRKTSNLNDFFLGGRSVGPWVSAFAYGTTYFSAVLFIGFAGKLGWGFGLNDLWIAFGNAIFGALLAWLVLGRRTRRMTQNLDVMTMPEFLQERYGAKYLKLLTTIIIFVFLLPYSASVFKGLGHLFEANFNIPYDYALLIMIGITGIYLILGGYFAITLTDFIQGLIMIVGAIMMVSILTGQAGGLGTAISTAMTNYAQHVPSERRPSLLLLVSLVFMTSFGTWGMPQMVQKFYAIKNESFIKKAAIVTCIFSIIISFCAYYTGALSHVFFDKPILNEAGTPDFDRMIPTLLTNQLPDALMALILLLVLSASMSTLSSLVLVSSSSIAIDMYKGHINPNVSEKGSLIFMRILSGIFVIVSYFIARYKIAVIVTLMSLSWGAIAGSFMAVYFYGLFWKKATRMGAWTGVISGLLVVIISFIVLGFSGYDKNSPIIASIAMLVPFVVVPVVSSFTKKPDNKLIDKAFENI